MEDGYECFFTEPTTFCEPVCGDEILVIQEDCEYVRGKPINGCDDCLARSGWLCLSDQGSCHEVCGNEITSESE